MEEVASLCTLWWLPEFGPAQTECSEVVVSVAAAAAVAAAYQKSRLVTVTS